MAIELRHNMLLEIDRETTLKYAGYYIDEHNLVASYIARGDIIIFLGYADKRPNCCMCFYNNSIIMFSKYSLENFFVEVKK